MVTKTRQLKKRALIKIYIDQLRGIPEGRAQGIPKLIKRSIPSTLKESGLLKVSLAEPTPELLEAALKQLEIQYRCNCDVGEVWEFKRKGEADFKEWSETQLIQLKLNIITEGYELSKAGEQRRNLSSS